LTAAPTKEDPVNQMPQAAPTTERPKPNATPKFAKPYGDIWVKTSAHPALQNSEVHVCDVDMLEAAVDCVTRCFRVACLFLVMFGSSLFVRQLLPASAGDGIGSGGCIPRDQSVRRERAILPPETRKIVVQMNTLSLWMVFCRSMSHGQIASYRLVEIVMFRARQCHRLTRL